MLPVDLTDDCTHRAVYLDIFRPLGPAFGSNLKERHLAPPLRLGVEKAAKGVDAIGDALRIVEAINPEDQTPTPETVAQPCRQVRCHGLARDPRIGRGIDADGKRANAHIAAAEFEGFAGRSRDAVPD